MVLAIDIGSSIIKGGLIAATGEFCGLYKFPAEFTVRSWHTGLKAICTSLSSKANRIEAVAVSGNGPTLVPVDKEGIALCNPISWFDKAGEKYLEEINLRTGGSINAVYFLSKIYYLYKQKPDLYRKTAWFFPCPEYINFILTGKPYTIRYCPGAESISGMTSPWQHWDWIKTNARP